MNQSSDPFFTSTLDNGIMFKSGREMLENGGIIDLESQDLTHAQAKAIRIQVQKDCELLRNRVRMLKLETEKARKKIIETRKRTKEIRELI